MLLVRAYLPLTPDWEREAPVVLVPSYEAVLLRDKGWKEMYSQEALWQLDRAMDPWWPGQLRSFVAAIDLHGSMSDTPDSRLLDIVRLAIENGSLVGLRKVDGAAKPLDETEERRRLVKKIDQLTRSKLNYAGRQYGLVVDIELAIVPSRNSYEVVSQADARRVLDGLAKQAAEDLATLLGQASAKLTADWRQPFTEPDGLILLRRIIERAVASRPDDGPAMTPSQMRTLMEKATLVIHVVDLKKKPQEGLTFEIKAPDGSSVSGKLDKEGRGRAQSSTPGIFTVSFPDLDGEDWDGDGALDLPDEERSEKSTHPVAQGDRLPTIAKDNGFARWQTVWDFDRNADLKELRGTAHILLPSDMVSIPSKLSREAEVPGGTAEYVVQTGAEVFRVRFLSVASSEDDPVTFKAKPDAGGEIEGTLSDDGALEIDLPPDTGTVHVDLFRADDEKDEDDEDGEGAGAAGGDDEGADGKPFGSYDFPVGGLDPIKEISGVQARLFGLGYYAGEITGEIDDETREAISHFRWVEGGDHKDVIDGDFTQALRKAHGS